MEGNLCPSRRRNELLYKLVGPPPAVTYFLFALKDPAFGEEIERICRVIDFIASVVKQWGIPYAAFA